MSKGSHRRPSAIPKDQLDKNWDRIFKRVKKSDSHDLKRNLSENVKSQSKS